LNQPRSLGAILAVVLVQVLQVFVDEFVLAPGVLIPAVVANRQRRLQVVLLAVVEELAVPLESVVGLLRSPLENLPTAARGTVKTALEPLPATVELASNLANAFFCASRNQRQAGVGRRVQAPLDAVDRSLAFFLFAAAEHLRVLGNFVSECVLNRD